MKIQLWAPKYSIVILAGLLWWAEGSCMLAQADDPENDTHKSSAQQPPVKIPRLLKALLEKNGKKLDDLTPFEKAFGFAGAEYFEQEIERLNGEDLKTQIKKVQKSPSARAIFYDRDINCLGVFNSQFIALPLIVRGYKPAKSTNPNLTDKIIYRELAREIGLKIKVIDATWPAFQELIKEQQMQAANAQVGSAAAGLSQDADLRPRSGSNRSSEGERTTEPDSDSPRSSFSSIKHEDSQPLMAHADVSDDEGAYLPVDGMRQRKARKSTPIDSPKSQVIQASKPSFLKRWFPGFFS